MTRATGKAPSTPSLLPRGHGLGFSFASMPGPRDRLRPLVRLVGATIMLALTPGGCGGGAPLPAGPASSATPVASSASAVASAQPAAPAASAAAAPGEVPIAPAPPPPTAGST